MDALFDAGQIILARFFADESGSLVIFSAESVEATRTIFDLDPWKREDFLVAGEIKEWAIFLEGLGKRD